jgi:heptosyltransferase-2
VNGRILLMAPNWLGDAVMALPAMRALRVAMPDAAIDVAARETIAPVFRLAGFFERVVTLDRGSGAPALSAGGYETAVLFPNSFRAAWLARRAGIAERWGYRTGFRSWLLTRSAVPPERVHQVDYYLQLVRALGFPAAPDVPRLAIADDLRAEGALMLKAAGWDGAEPLMAMAPGAAFGTAKRWPSGSFASLADRLASEGFRTVVLGSDEDRLAGIELTAAMRAPAPPIDLVGRTDLLRLAGVLAHCRTLVTNDSGAMHFSAALGVNLVAMFGPTREDETSPRGAGRHTVLTHPVWCRPCMLRECPLTHRCMTGISVEAVHAAVLSLA